MAAPAVSAGIAIWRTGPSGPEILLVHPTNASWQKPTLSIPKGHVEPGEQASTAASREVLEEIGWEFGAPELTPGGSVENLKDGRVVKRVEFFLALGDTLPAVLPKTDLQLTEVDWAGFVPVGEALSKVTPYQQPIVDHVARAATSRPRTAPPPTDLRPVETPTTIRGWISRGVEHPDQDPEVDFPRVRAVADTFPAVLRDLSVEKIPEEVWYSTTRNGTDPFFTHRWDLPDGSTVGIYPWAWTEELGYLAPGSFVLAMWYDRAQKSDPDEIEWYASWRGQGEQDALSEAVLRYSVTIPEDAVGLTP